MDPISLLAILVLAGAIVVLLYYYLQNSSNASVGKFKSQVYEFGDRVGGQETMSGMGEKTAGVSEKMSGVGERMSGMSDKIMGKVKEVPISTDVLSNKIDSFLDEKSDELIKDWDLATKTDINDLEKRMNVVTRDIDELEQRFNEYRGFTNKKMDSFDERLKNLEGIEEEKPEE
jgi:predicted RNase H-like nuclease (RuvC/YqgF family)